MEAQCDSAGIVVCFAAAVAPGRIGQCILERRKYQASRVHPCHVLSAIISVALLKKNKLRTSLRGYWGWNPPHRMEKILTHSLSDLSATAPVSNNYKERRGL
eukprot:752994-Hanusia_phi.AAC.1